MTSSGSNEQAETKQKYVFFADPEAVAERAQKSGRILQNQQFAHFIGQEQCSRQVASGNLAGPSLAAGPKNLDSLLAHQTVKPHPFTFITALKRKLAVAAYNETSKNLYHPASLKPAENPDSLMNNINSSSKETLYQAVQKMDFIKPLKVPDVKISPKTLDYSPKDAANTRDPNSLKFAMTSQKCEKSSKIMDRAHRKLDFSLSESHSLISSDEIEPLKVPELSISPSLSKKKDHTRDNSRDRDNRTKRTMKKDEAVAAKIEDSTLQDSAKQRTKLSKHVSRKDVTESKRLKNDRLSSHATKECDFVARKPKNKNFATSTTKKDDDKRLRSSSIHSTKSVRDKSLESRVRTLSSSDSLSDRNFKIHEKIVRDNSRINDSDSSALKYNDDYQILNALRQIDEQKQKISENKPPKMQTRFPQTIQQKSNDITAKDQHKRIVDRSKSSINKTTARTSTSTSEIYEEIETLSDSNSNKNRNSKISGSMDSQTNSHNTTQLSSEEIVLDPTKVSFRDDSYSQQDEFCDLVTPEINLIARTKRRKPTIPDVDCDSDCPKTPKHKTTSRSEPPSNPEVPLMHPTALHMQFQAELHLFDSYNESLRQVTNVENSLSTVKHERSKELLYKQKLANEDMKKQLMAMQVEKPIRESAVGKVASFPEDNNDVPKVHENANDEPAASSMPDATEHTDDPRNSNNNRNKDFKTDVKVAEVQTQTANDIATQTEMRVAKRAIAERLERYPGITYDRGGLTNCEIPELSLNSMEQFDDIENIEDVSLPNKMRTMSEISLHETTSSIKTETGTEISISTRDVTCSFNKYLDLEMAQLIKDEKLMYDKIEMLFKSREKTLNDRTRKLVKLEEQKRVLRDTGQDSRISSVKKKQRALLLKLQQEKDEMNRLKELHKMASQERKLMLQKQRNMFNPQMSTKNILTKLKRSADCQSPRRLSGPMKGYDIRSNSSMSSLVDSDKSQLERSHVDVKLQLSDSSQKFDGNNVKSDLESSTIEKMDPSNCRRYMRLLEETGNCLNNLDQLNEFMSRFDDTEKLESKTKKFEEKMPSLKMNYTNKAKHGGVCSSHGKIVESVEVGAKTILQNVDNSEYLKSESDTLVEELSKKSKSTLNDNQIFATIKDKDPTIMDANHGDADAALSRKSKASQVTEESLLINHKATKKCDKSTIADREAMKKLQSHESKMLNKRKGSKNVKGKSTSNILTENILRTKGNNTHVGDEVVKSTSKRTKTDKDIGQTDEHNENSILEELDMNDSQNSLQALVKHSRAVKDKNYKIFRDIASEHETKENILTRNVMERGTENRENNSRRDDGDVHNLGNISTRSQVSTFTISRHSSGDSEKSFSRSVVIRAQDHRFKTSKKLEQVLNAREAALTTRRNCVEDWIAWHTKLKAEESRVARMEQAAFKLVSTTANVLPYHDTTMSSDTSDVEGRVELLAEKLAEKRAEMAKLKREARRQAKQRLKALEANLLSQIKKYDTTIHEMRKKLETQKTSLKDSDKLAIESRSVTDFKVPEIPMKRIQEIYKSSDLLRSRSESDLIVSKTLDATVNDWTTKNRDKSRENVYKSSSSLDNKLSRLSRLSSGKDAKTNQSVESVLEESNKFSHQTNSEKQLKPASKETSKANESLITESIVSEALTSLQNSATSAAERSFETPKDRTRTEKFESSENEEISEAIRTIATDENTKTYSRELENVQMTNRNLNDDISTLENDLKALSEMMSHFSKKSDEKLKFGSVATAPATTEPNDVVTMADSVAKSTSKDISEQLSQSVHTELPEELSRSARDSPIPISTKTGDSVDEKSSIFRDIEKSQSSLVYSENTDADVTEVISAIIPDGQSSSAKTDENIDFEARSKEILNVIEKSLISEHVKSPSSDVNSSNENLEESMKDIIEENEALSQDLDNLEGDIKSISKIISEMAESKRGQESAVDKTNDACVFDDSLESREQLLDSSVLQPRTESPRMSSSSEHISHREISHNDELENHNIYLQEQISEIENELSRIDSRRESLVNPISDISEEPVVRDDIISEISSKDENISNQIPSKDGKILDEIPSKDGKITDEIPSKDAKISDEIETKDAKVSDVISARSPQTDIDEATKSIVEELSASQPNDNLSVDDSGTSKKSDDETEEIDHDATNESSLEENSINDNDEHKETEGISIGKVSLENDWTISDSFQVPEKSDVPQNNWEETLEPNADETIEPCDISPMNLTVESPDNRRDTQNFTCDIEDVSMFVPRGESTNIGYKFDESAINVTKTDSMQTDELDDILDIIARESNQTIETHKLQQQSLTTSPIENVSTNDHERPIVITPPTSDRIVPRPSDLNLTCEVEPVLQKLTEILQGVERNIARRRRSATDSDSHRDNHETKESTVTRIYNLESGITNKLVVVDDEKSNSQTRENENYVTNDVITIDKPISEIVESPTSPTTINVSTTIPTAEIPLSDDDREPTCLNPLEDCETVKITEISTNDVSTCEPRLNDKTFEIIKGPEYEDISEESLEVSEILDRSESQRSSSHSKISKIPEKYEITQKSEDVLRILDAISQRSYVDSEMNRQRHVHDVEINVQVFGSMSPGFATKMDYPAAIEREGSKTIVDLPNEGVEIAVDDDYSTKDGFDDGDDERLEKLNDSQGQRCSGEKMEEDDLRRKELDGSSEESSEGADTPRGVSEIEMDSPRDPNESRLDVDALDDDLIGCNDTEKSVDDKTVDFHVTPVIVNSEKDIETMIDKLKASLEQPGLEVAELEAKLLRIEQLQIELEIKKLEAEEVSFYVREIPNKPPPPYTPPGGGSRLPTPQVSPTLPPAVVPSNVEELTAFTEKATVLIFNAKNSGVDIMTLQPPNEICELSKDNNETAKHDRRIYNTFLFDLCKETIAELYRSEYEKPGPSWTKPNVKTKPAMKIPKTVDELNEYVSKEVATLFGFKTKLQRENMVMRWSRKRRDRVDELLAREAQAEEDEWTKFHHDELAVKNELTIAILDTLILETANVVKTVYAKKRRVMA